MILFNYLFAVAFLFSSVFLIGYRLSFSVLLIRFVSCRVLFSVVFSMIDLGSFSMPVRDQ